jgi:hypothetical protein
MAGEGIDGRILNEAAGCRRVPLHRHTKGLLHAERVAVVGLGTFRSWILFEEVLTVSLMCFWFLFTWAIVHCTSHAAFSVALFLLNADDLYLFRMFVSTNICRAIRLHHFFYPARDAVMALKLEIVCRFGGYVTV